MKSPDLNYFNIGPRLTLTFALLIALILGGNSLLIWQFYQARLQSDRLTSVSQQLIAVQRLRQRLLAFHQRLDEVAQSRDAFRLAAETEPLRRELLEQTRRTRSTLAHLPSETPIDPAVVPTLEAIEITLPSQIEAINSLAAAGDWEALRLRLANELKPLETQTLALVKSIDQEMSAELAPAVTNMQIAQRRILLIVPAMAISTFLIAAFFGWALTRRILELRMEERVNERARIARELHDTLLQGFISASMQLNVATDQLPADSPAKPALARVQQVMDQVIEEGRNAIRGVRSLDRESQDLGPAFSRIPQELDLTEQIDFRVIVGGRSQSLRPAIRDDVYLIGREALVNSFRHARASRIEVQLEYSPRQLRLLVGDDGRGIDPALLQAGRDGHWGLSGMRERAARIGAKLKLLSRPGGGTEVELRVPSHVAFESPSSSAASKWFAALHRGQPRTPAPTPKQPAG